MAQGLNEQVVPKDLSSEYCPFRMAAEEEKEKSRKSQVPLQHKIEQLTTDIQCLSQWDNNWHGKNFQSVTQHRDVYLIRHGDYDKTVPPYHLTPKGIQQARATGRRLHKLITHNVLSSTKIVHSHLLRAHQTAQEMNSSIQPSLTLEQDTLLNEGYPVQDSEQFEEAFRKFFYRSNYIEPNILVCHANIIRSFICRCTVYKLPQLLGTE